MTDSKAVVFILSGGSRNSRLQALSMSVFLTLRKYRITLIPVWKSRDSDIITRANMGSRDFRSDDYSLDPVTFDFLKSKFGPFDVDCMANSANAVVQKFFSRYFSIGTSGINFFAQSLDKEENHFCFPPVKRAVDAIQHLERFGTRGLLVIPVWPRSQIYSYFFPDGVHAADWVTTLDFINPRFISNINVGECFKGYQEFKTVALGFDFRRRGLSFTPSFSRFLCLKSGCYLCV